MTGTFNEATRSVISRWQAARGYPKSGYLNKLQHKALLSEILATAQSASDDEAKPTRRERRGGGGGHRRGGGGGPGGLIGGMMGGMFR